MPGVWSVSADMSKGNKSTALAKTLRELEATGGPKRFVGQVAKLESEAESIKAVAKSFGCI